MFSSVARNGRPVTVDRDKAPFEKRPASQRLTITFPATLVAAKVISVNAKIMAFGTTFAVSYKDRFHDSIRFKLKFQ